MSHTWFVVPAADVAAFRAAYDSIVSEEAVGTLYPNADGSLAFCGSGRITTGERDAVLAAVPTAVAYDEWPPAGGWNYPEDSP